MLQKYKQSEESLKNHLSYGINLEKENININCKASYSFEKLVNPCLLLDSDDKFETTAKKDRNWEYQTPIYTKLLEDKYESTMAIESEFKILKNKINREEIGNDLKLQWTQMMQEFEQGTRKQLKETILHHSEQME